MDQMHMRLLDGKKALVTGVANKRSIAWGIARALHFHGAEVAFTCIEGNLRRVKTLAQQVNSEIVIPCDVQKDDDIVSAVDEVKEFFNGKLDIFVHSIAFAGLEDIGGEFISVSRSGWNLALEISAYSLVAFARHVRPLMNAAGGGTIITMTFGGANAVVPGYNIMGVAKAALNAAIIYLAYDLGPDNIRVNGIAAGPVPTLSSQMIENFETALKLVEEKSPLLRNITVENLGDTAVYLASELSSTLTGTIMKVDSGMHVLCPPTGPGHLKGARQPDDSV